MKTRRTKDDAISVIVESVKRSLSTVSERCAESLKALTQGDYLIALGAVLGLEQELAKATSRLLVLREIAEHKNKNKRKRGSK